LFDATRKNTNCGVPLLVEGEEDMDYSIHTTNAVMKGFFTRTVFWRN